MSSVRYGVSKPQIIREQFDEEVVIVDLDSGNYYSLGGAGGEVWSSVENGASQEEIVTRLSLLYDADSSVIAPEIQRLLEELQQEQLIAERSDAPPADGSAPTISETRRVWQTPMLQKFTDMQALLLLDPIHEVDSAGWPQPKPEEPAAP